ncbi:hypothetical protein GCM10011610_62730 [Nocardia rhizosphaerihabitans]|uniref:Uncharacterized protein n=1 Tax=Nocardia rhizosphaerihabitans TaxID=1691570 RepID=A0ABQ2L0G0_9NOCA|nr:hypothetical protein GCM10011610_62730 [Nocardia rhizosphaerihabitans]
MDQREDQLGGSAPAHPDLPARCLDRLLRMGTPPVGAEFDDELAIRWCTGCFNCRDDDDHPGSGAAAVLRDQS